MTLQDLEALEKKMGFEQRDASPKWGTLRGLVFVRLSGLVHGPAASAARSAAATTTQITLHLG